MKVVLADDHTLVRSGIRALLASLPDVTVVAEAQDGREAVQLAHQHQPDVVLMDVAMPGMIGLEATERITHDLPRVKVLILSMHANEEYVCQALRSGASGYLLKDATASELESALGAVVRGDTYLSPRLSTKVAEYLRRVGVGTRPLERLTPRQREILQLIAEGKTSREIAEILGISVKTVETHRTQLMETLDIHEVAGLVRYAVRTGLVPAE